MNSVLESSFPLKIFTKSERHGVNARRMALLDGSLDCSVVTIAIGRLVGRSISKIISRSSEITLEETFIDLCDLLTLTGCESLTTSKKI